MGMWRTKVTSQHNHIPIEVQVGDDTTIRMVRSGEGVFSVVIDAPREKTIVRKAGEPVPPDMQSG